MVNLARVVITGGESSIAKEISFGIRLNHRTCDVTSEKSTGPITTLNPSALLHLASVPLQECEHNPRRAYEVNVFGTKRMAELAAKLDIPLIIISTGAIFNGPLGAIFDEKAVPDPQNIYGKTKYLAELVTLAASRKNLVIRTGWLFGVKDKKDGFSGFVEKARIALGSNQQMQATANQQGSPTLIGDFINVLKDSILLERKGILHAVNAGNVSAYEMLTFMKKALQSTSDITPLQADTMQEPRRSLSEALQSSLSTLSSWEDSLQRHLASRSNVQ